MADLEGLVQKLFLPGAVYTFVGAGGKSTAMRQVAKILARGGLRPRMTTTTRIGIEEFSNFPVVLAASAGELTAACGGREPVRLIVSATLARQGKYLGIDSALLEEIEISDDSVLLVEGDGSRRKPLKVPMDREPVIPARSALVFALMGAAGFGEPIDEEHCYNHQAASGIVPSGSRSFDAPSLAAIAAHPAGCRKGVLPGMGFHVLMNQGDLADKRRIGDAALGILAKQGIDTSLVSLQQEVVYETSRL